MLTAIGIFFYVLGCILTITLVLMHNPQESGLGSVGGGAGTGGGGQHVMERNLDRVTIVVSMFYVVLTILLARFWT